MTADIFDPNSWSDEPPHEHRIYGDANAQTWVVVDAVDYQWAIQWRWHFNTQRGARLGKKEYMVRQPSNGRRFVPKIFLHVEILKRSKKRKPSPLHKIADHKDGKERNCRRSNLRWATISMNNKRNPNRGNRRTGKKSAR